MAVIKASRKDLGNAYEALSKMTIAGQVPRKFRYSKERNIAKLHVIVQGLAKAQELSPEYQKQLDTYQVARTALLEEHALRDDNGDKIVANPQVPGSYKITSPEAWTAALSALDAEHSSVLHELKRVDVEIKSLLEEEEEVTGVFVFVESSDPNKNTMADLAVSPANDQYYRSLMKVGLISNPELEEDVED